MKRCFVLYCLCLLLSTICSAQGTRIVISSRAPDMAIYIENVETGKVYKSKPIGFIAKSYVIDNIPVGLYEVCRVEVKRDNLYYWNNSFWLRRYWGTIDIRPNTNYYLGYYKSTETGRLSRRQVCLALMSMEMPDRLVRFLEKRGLSNEDFIPVMPWEDTFVVAEYSYYSNKFFSGGCYMIDHQYSSDLDLLF